MMQYPLTIEQFQYPEFEKGTGKEFITAFINAINNVYEKGRRVKFIQNMRMKHGGRV